jgi:hypothetical protein
MIYNWFRFGYWYSHRFKVNYYYLFCILIENKVEILVTEFFSEYKSAISTVFIDFSSLLNALISSQTIF